MATAEPCTTVKGLYAFARAPTDGPSFALHLACACGEQLVVSDTTNGFVAGLALGCGGILLDADEGAVCPSCQAYLLPLWNSAAYSLFGEGEGNDGEP